MKKLPLGIQTFAKLRGGDYLYVDKTETVYNLLVDGGQYYFLSRPRRFGKSLLISTLKELFTGNKELFKDLWIYNKITWEKYPVIHLDFLGLENNSQDALINSLEYMVNRNADEFGITLTESGYNQRFKELVAHLAKIDRVVILVDEYDKPIIDNLDNIPVATANRKILKTFYETIKESDRYVKFVFITGVSKFSRVSVFSGLNNLTDITISEKFSTIAGYTQDELNHYFDDRMEALSEKLKVEKDALQNDIKNWYNGYSWDGNHFVYNPYSILTLFNESRIDNFWFVSGTPTFLLQLIKNHKIDVTNLDGYRTGGAIFDSFDIENMNIYSLLFQTGYLTIKTIKGSGGKRDLYTLAYPNLEVKESFLEHLLAQFSSRFANEVSVIAYDLKESLKIGDIEESMKILSSLFAGISYNMFVGDKEGYYQTVIYLTLKLIGIDIQAEVETNIGRIDAVIETDTAIYVLEFKMGKAETAINQIKEKKYHQKYLNNGKPVQIIGIGFGPEEGNISGYLMETVS
jgi:Predicted AAA-ATPase/PD-(D/E)XK nuclease superfamily